jgi:DNA-binding transcriptional LysR family regulator
MGTPSGPDQLKEHSLLTLQLGNAPERTWTLLQAAGETQVVVDSPMCGDGLLVRQWAVAGHGVAFKGLFDVIDDLESGRLARVLPQVAGSRGAIHAVFPSKKFIPARVRALVEELAADFAAREARCQAWLIENAKGRAQA